MMNTTLRRLLLKTLEQEKVMNIQEALNWQATSDHAKLFIKSLFLIDEIAYSFKLFLS